MPRSSGTATPPAGQPVIAGTVISSSVQNTLVNDIYNELTNSIPRDGTAPPTANLPMGNFKITGLGAATLATDAPQYQQIQSGASLYLTAVAGTNTITGTLASPTLAAYAAGNTFRFTAAGTNTGATTVNINALGAKTIQRNGTALVAGDITSGQTYEIIYDGTNFQIIGVFSARAGANSDITSLTALTSIPNGIVTPANLSTGHPSWDASGLLTVPGTSPDIRQFKTDNAADQKYWRQLITTNSWQLETVNDAYSAAASAYIVTRSGNTVTNHLFLTNGVQQAQIGALGNFSFNSGYGSMAVAYGCRAWVNFNGTGTVAIRGNGNVSSITDNGVGDYTVNFITAMPDANYAASVSGGGSSTAPVANANVMWPAVYSTTSLRIGSSDNNTDTSTDMPNIGVTIFR